MFADHAIGAFAPKTLLSIADVMSFPIGKIFRPRSNIDDDFLFGPTSGKLVSLAKTGIHPNPSHLMLLDPHYRKLSSFFDTSYTSHSRVVDLDVDHKVDLDAHLDADKHKDAPEPHTVTEPRVVDLDADDSTVSRRRPRRTDTIIPLEGEPQEGEDGESDKGAKMDVAEEDDKAEVAEAEMERDLSHKNRLVAKIEGFSKATKRKAKWFGEYLYSSKAGLVDGTGYAFDAAKLSEEIGKTTRDNKSFWDVSEEGVKLGVATADELKKEVADKSIPFLGMYFSFTSWRESKIFLRDLQQQLKRMPEGPEKDLLRDFRHCRVRLYKKERYHDFLGFVLSAASGVGALGGPAVTSGFMGASAINSIARYAWKHVYKCQPFLDAILDYKAPGVEAAPVEAIDIPPGEMTKDEVEHVDALSPATQKVEL